MLILLDLLVKKIYVNPKNAIGKFVHPLNPAIHPSLSDILKIPIFYEVLSLITQTYLFFKYIFEIKVRNILRLTFFPLFFGLTTIPGIHNNIANVRYNMLYFYKIVPGNPLFFHINLTPKKELCSPIVQNGILYQGLADGTILSQDIKNKRILWEYHVVGQPTSLIMSQEKIITTTLKGFIYVLDINNGNLIWSYNTHKEIISKPVIDNNMLYLQTTLDTLYAFNISDGTLNWQYNEKNIYEGLLVHLTPSPYISNDVLYTGFSNGDAIALNATNGQIIWLRKPPTTKQLQDIIVRPVGNSQVVLFASYDNGIFCLNKKDGTLVWERNDLIRATALYISETDIYATFVNGMIYRLDLRTGDSIWKTNLGEDPGLTPPELYNNKIILGVEKGKYKGLVLLDPFTGFVVGHFPIVSGVSAPPTIINNKIYAVSNGGFLYCFQSTIEDIKEGKSRNIFNFP